jgi:hypothetical protein
LLWLLAYSPKSRGGQLLFSHPILRRQYVVDTPIKYIFHWKWQNISWEYSVKLIISDSFLRVNDAKSYIGYASLGQNWNNKLKLWRNRNETYVRYAMYDRRECSIQKEADQQHSIVNQLESEILLRRFLTVGVVRNAYDTVTCTITCLHEIAIQGVTLPIWKF